MSNHLQAASIGTPNAPTPTPGGGKKTFLIPIIIGFVLISFSCYWIFFSTVSDKPFQKIVLGVLLSIGCGLLFSVSDGEFKFGDTFKVTGGVGIACFLLFQFQKQIEKSKESESGNENLAPLYEAFVNFSGFDIKLEVVDSADKTLIKANNSKEVVKLIKDLSFDPGRKELDYEFEVRDSSVLSKSKEIKVTMIKSAYRLIIGDDGRARFNRADWGIEIFPDNVLFHKPLSQRNSLTLTLK